VLVLETDYDNFATVYSCKDFPVIGKFEYTRVLARDPKPSDDLVILLFQINCMVINLIMNFENRLKKERLCLPIEVLTLQIL